MQVLFCSECTQEQLFEQPPCEDGHGVDCPEWICTACGLALLHTTYPAFDLPPVRPARVPVATGGRHAA